MIADVLSGEARYHVEHGEALEVLLSMPDACVDAVVTDPPAGIAFMGKTWDHDHGGREGWVRAFAAIFRECLRVLKPGGRAFVWSIPRTSHWTACAVEDAGFVIENTVAHVFGSGFPKGKGQLKPAREDWILCRKPGGKVQPLQIDRCRVGTNAGWSYPNGAGGNGFHGGVGRPPDGTRTASVSSTAGRWPPNLVLSHAEGCERVGEKRVKGSKLDHDCSDSYFGRGTVRKHGHTDADGSETVEAWRCVDGCPVKLLGEQSGARASTLTGRADPNQHHILPRISSKSGYGGGLPPGNVYADAGTAARFFPQFEPDPPPFYYAAKASRRERNAGCEGLLERDKRTVYGDGFNSATKVCTVEQAEHGVDRGKTSNHHPTVKPQALMRWLIRLITPPGGVVLDCFAGSGSTIVAAITEGCRAIGVEREAEYVEIARRRAEAARIGRATREPTKAGRPIVAASKDQRQRNLFE